MIEGDFFFGPGSRYSYLASTQIASIARDTGAIFRWRPVYSPDLIQRAGPNPFSEVGRRGQYQSDYRTKDAARWAQYYAVPYEEPDLDAGDWRSIALACVAAELLGAAEQYARLVFTECFTKGLAPQTPDELTRVAEHAGLPIHEFGELLRSDDVEAKHESTLAEAVSAGAFGVPTFVVGEELFWGQDRLVLLREHLLRHG